VIDPLANQNETDFSIYRLRLNDHPEAPDRPQQIPVRLLLPKLHKDCSSEIQSTWLVRCLPASRWPVAP
jgi:hypothetical protein